MSGPLEGYRVVELTSTVSGPFAGMMLADQGADVVKVEPPGIGDLARFMGTTRSGMAAMFSVLNRNKRSVVLDFKEAKDFEILKNLLATADVLIENYRPGVVKKLGLDYESIKKINSNIIYTSISGYGQSGPYINRRVYDPLIQATAGAAASQDSENPEYYKTIVFDKVTGLTAAQSISTALLHRERTGEGQYLPISMLDSALYYIWPDVMWSKTLLGEGIDYKPDLFESFPLFKAKDKPISVIVVADSDFQRFCEVIGCKLYEEEKYATFEQRVLNKETLIPEIEKYLEDKEADVLCEELDKMGIPVASINQLDEIHKDPQVIEQGSLVEVEHPLAGKMRMPKPPFNFFNQNDFPKSHAPILGQHNREVLSELGVEEKELKRMEERERVNKEMIEGMKLADVANASRD
ncbi:MAG TPA: CoA transferase [Gammaproteobacteria bacterium]|jgi:crotonobetainyl-CoA:carnitine CoA-transferase CaiB-like acyl-CoA transferase|nr:CoA transferase [Gammaproteobacteria bacterium]HIN74428.1 CoA transferase [Gammaproteobacteria bacterium]HIO43299.1 CoA transferase [Gammaproteobacteria bacterium]|tara:strand:+ start:2534 stop:3760 length:1227 start_codon:yes stop_codon:yes gene_type:complete